MVGALVVLPTLVLPTVACVLVVGAAEAWAVVGAKATAVAEPGLAQPEPETPIPTSGHIEAVAEVGALVVLLTLVFPTVACVFTVGAVAAWAVVGATTAAVAEPGLGLLDGLTTLAEVGAEAETETLVFPLPACTLAAGAAEAPLVEGAEALAVTVVFPALTWTEAFGLVLTFTEAEAETETDVAALADPLTVVVEAGAVVAPAWVGAWTVTREPSASATRPVR